MRGRSGTGLGDELDRLARRLDRTGGGVKQVLVHRSWQHIAGPTVVEHTTGAHLRAGELIVYVDSPVWATELSALSEHYREALNADLGEELVGAVRFTVSRKVEESARLVRQDLERDETTPADKVASVPLSEQELAQVEASTAGIEDEELREAVIRATVADLEWKKGMKAAKFGDTPRESL